MDLVECWAEYEENVLRRVSYGRLGGLPCWLLISSLLHVLPFVFLYFADMHGNVVAAELRRQPVLTATLNRSREVALAVSPVAKVLSPMLEQDDDGLAQLSARRDDAGQARNSGTEEANPQPIPGMNYYAADELTTQPRALGEPVLDPKEVAGIIASGKLVLALSISDHGDVVDVFVEHSDLPEIFSQVATEGFRNLQFVPGELNGQKVGALMRIEVGYADDRLPAP